VGGATSSLIYFLFFLTEKLFFLCFSWTGKNDAWGMMQVWK